MGQIASIGLGNVGAVSQLGGLAELQPQQLAERPAAENQTGVAGVERLPNLLQARIGAAQGAVAPNVELRGAGRSGFKAFFSAIGNWFKKKFAKSEPEPVTVAVPGVEDRVTIDRAEYEPMIKALPKSQRAAARNNLVQNLENRIRNGAEVYRMVLDAGNVNDLPSTTTGQVSDLVLFLRAKASAKGQGFINGAMSIEDPGGKLHKFLKRCAQSYTRSSSHLSELQQLNDIDGDRNIQRSIDIASGPDGLPCGHKTVLFGAIVPPPGVDREVLPQRLFLKTESHGCWLSTIGGGDQVAARRVTGGSDRPYRFGDLMESLGHGLSFLSTRGKSNALGSRKEHLSSDIKGVYEMVLSELKSSKGPSFAEMRRLLEEAKVTEKGYGIRSLNLALDKIVNSRDVELTLRTSKGHTLKEIVNVLRGAVRVSGDNATVRLGNEVILNHADLYVNHVNQLRQ